MKSIEVIQSADYYKVKPTNLWPEIIINHKLQEISFKGFSLMADPLSFYEQVFKLIKKVIKEYNFKRLKVSFHFFYINTQSLKQIVSFFSYFETLKIPVEVIWYYSDEEIAELGSHICDLSNIPVKLKYSPEDKNSFNL